MLCNILRRNLEQIEDCREGYYESLSDLARTGCQERDGFEFVEKLSSYWNGRLEASSAERFPFEGAFLLR